MSDMGNVYFQLVTTTTVWFHFSTKMRNVHFTGACGRAIGKLALELQNQGWKVTASDDAMYPPMDKVLQDEGLEISPVSSADNVPEDTEVLVRATHIRSDHVEVQRARTLGIPVCHMAEFLGKYLLHQELRIVVAGTNGKTTTTAMLAWILECAGLAPDYFIGATIPDLPSSVRFRGSSVAAVEGDEYFASVENPEPKFLSYKPTTLVLTNLAYDHSEVYPDFDALKHWFVKLISLLPETGKLIVSGDCPEALQMAEQARCQVDVVGGRGDRRKCLQVTSFRSNEEESEFTFCDQKFTLKQPGLMNARNAAMAALAAMGAGVSLQKSAEALSRFSGIKGRLEVRLSVTGATLVLDEGYHPDAMEANIAALRSRYPGRPLLVFFQPRHTGGRDGYVMRDMPAILAKADALIISKAFDHTEFPTGKFSNVLFAKAIREHGGTVQRLKRIQRVHYHLPKLWKPDMVVLCSLPAGCEVLTDPLAEQINKLAAR